MKIDEHGRVIFQDESGEFALAVSRFVAVNLYGLWQPDGINGRCSTARPFC